jgi:nicotinic acid mononucleotide adenylyltransferase
MFPDLAGTDVRTLLQNGASAAGVVPGTVLELIFEHGLYGAHQ